MILKGILKMKNKKGFTLAELLIAVAIIAVLVAVSIPIFSSQLEKSREATDAANIRSQYSEIMVEALSEGKDVNTDGSRKIPLEQKQDDWQNDTFKNSLEGIATVEGTPKTGGNAWVSFEAESSKVTIHFDGTGGEPSGGGGTDTDSETVQTNVENRIGTLSLETGDHKIMLESPVTTTIKILIRHGQGHGQGSAKTIEIQINPSQTEYDFHLDTKINNGAYSVVFTEGISQQAANDIMNSLQIS
ncbi:MAG: pilin [Erysipelotrichaceae bacterium]|nr:pilin [Erysipelotrichaceae bacterium]